MAEKVYKGRTEDAANPFLSAEFWKKGTKIAGVVERLFKAGDQQCMTVHLVDPVLLDGVEVEVVSIGAMAGLRMAIQAAHLHGLAEGDRLWLECTGHEPAKKAGNSPRANFKLELTRDEELVEEETPF